MPHSPTPEEISERLEALLERTHALRVQQSAARASDTGAVGSLVPGAGRDHDSEMRAAAGDDHDHGASVAPSAAPAESAATAGTFGRPDWAELRRGSEREAATGSRWLWLLTLVLAAATLGQAVYMWRLHTTRATSRDGSIRVDGPEGALVRVDGREVGPAPLEHTLAPGEYQVEIGNATGAARAERVTVGAGGTVLLLPLTPPRAASAPPSLPVLGTPAGSPAPGTAGTPSASTGAVLIESAPPGLPVTMEGRPRGVTPLTIDRLRPGRHDVMVGALARQVEITAGQTARLSISAQP